VDYFEQRSDEAARRSERIGARSRRFKPFGALALALRATRHRSRPLRQPRRCLPVDASVPVAKGASELGQAGRAGGNEMTTRKRARAPVAGARPAETTPDSRGAVEPQARFELDRAVDRAIISQYAPPSVVLDAANRVLQFRGYTGAFLQPAQSELHPNILRIARDGLTVELRTAVARARATGEPVRTGLLSVRSNGGCRNVVAHVLPLRGYGDGPPQPEQGCCLVLFTEPHGEVPAGEGASRDPNDAPALEAPAERSSAQEYVQWLVNEQDVAIRELRSANEEIFARNEELHSLTEQLDAAKEELRSTNEELVRFNDELLARNVELSRANAEIESCLASAGIPMVMVGRDLRIRRFTSSAAGVLRLIPGDVGRPVGDIKPRIDTPDLERLFHQVLTTEEKLDAEVRDGAGRWYSLHMRPYRSANGQIDGVVLCLVDIDSLKRAITEVGAWQGYAAPALESARRPSLLLDAALRVIRANPAYYRMFASQPDETEQAFFYEVGAGRWNISSLRHLLEEILPTGNELVDYRVESDCPRVGPRVLSLSGRRLIRQPDGSAAIVIEIDELAPPGGAPQ
jgi:two-component system CheB/CheR fusion protein